MSERAMTTTVEATRDERRPLHQVALRVALSAALWFALMSSGEYLPDDHVISIIVAPMLLLLVGMLLIVWCVWPLQRGLK